MKVFISWSGERSNAVARALRDWLPRVIQSLQPWMSASDIEKGARWGTDMAHELKDARVGIICLTPENLEAPWILFEAGALSKTLEKTFVCPYLFEVEPADISGPLVQFQTTRAVKEETRQLIQTINRALEGNAVSDNVLNVTFEKWWPDLENALKEVPPSREEEKSQRSEREILEEILELVREQKRLMDPGTLVGRQRLIAGYRPLAERQLHRDLRRSVRLLETFVGEALGEKEEAPKEKEENKGGET